MGALNQAKSLLSEAIAEWQNLRLLELTYRERQVAFIAAMVLLSGLGVWLWIRAGGVAGRRPANAGPDSGAGTSVFQRT